MISACVCVVLAASASAAPIGAFTTKGAWSFVSEPKLHPVQLKASGHPNYKRLAQGDFFLAILKNETFTRPLVGQSGPLIVDSHMQPIWFSSVGTHAETANLKLQTYNGKPALSWWQGVINKVGAAVQGEVVVVDQSYKQIAKLTAPKGSGWVISLHDVAISGTNAWVTAYRNVPHVNLKPYHGPASGTLYDSAVQEYDLKTGKLLFTWDAYNPGHTANVPLSASYQKPIGKTPWDAYHLNAIQLVGSHQFLVSMRNTWAAYLVDMTTNKIVWTLGGKNSSFKPKTPFHFEHDVELHGSNVVSVFDDSCCALTASGLGKDYGPSRGLILKLDFAHHTVKQVAQYKHGTLLSGFLGNTQLVSGGNVVVGWGAQPFFSEFNKSGQLLLDVRWPIPDQSYRAYVEKWVGTPFFPPSGAVRKHGTAATVYASWNGATEVASWDVFAGTDAKHLKSVGKGKKNGFETAITLKKAYKVYEVKALDSHGKVLRTSSVFH